MPANLMPSGAELLRLLPEIILVSAATLLMVLEAVLSRKWQRSFGHISTAALLAAIAASIQAYDSPGAAFSGMLMVDGFATFFRVLVMAVGILIVLSSYRYLAREGAETGEYHALLLY